MLNIESLSFGYTPKNLILKRLSTQLHKGSITGLLGANGVGKSTLMRLIAGLLYPNNGSLTAADHTPAKRQATFLNQVYLVPEKTWLPDVQSDTFVNQYSVFYPNFDHALFNQYAQRFELKHPHLLRDYSFGQQKKFLLAFAFATKAKLILLDEPTNGLDIPAKEQFRQVLLETITDEQSVIISTHQARDLEGTIDTVMLMDNEQLLTYSLEHLNTLFSVEKYSEKPSDTIYAAQTFSQWLCLTPFRTNCQRELDLELLFNGFHQNKSQFVSALSSPALQNPGAAL